MTGQKKLTFGFTITEVTIVLAVVGMMFLIVFAAIPALKRSQRDSQRRSIALRLKTEVETYAANNEGQYPFGGVDGTQFSCKDSARNTFANSCYDLYNNYINGKLNITDPSSGSDVGIYYDNNVATPTNNPWTPGNMYIIPGAKCSGSGVSGTSGANSSAKDYAFAIALDSTNSWTCIDNT